MKQTRQNQGRFGGSISSNPRTTSIIVIAVNAVVWAIIQLSGPFRASIVDILGLIPMGLCEAVGGTMYYPSVGPEQCASIQAASWVPGVATGAWWQVLSSIFTHQAFYHIAANCLTLWFLGPALESVLGRARFLTTYLASGLTGSLCVMWLSGVHSVSIGGSGATFGLMGALLVVFLTIKRDVRQLLIWLGINVIVTVVGIGSISWQAHLGGLVGGALIAWIWTAVPAKAKNAQWLAIAALILLVGGGIVLRAILI